MEGGNRPRFHRLAAPVRIWLWSGFVFCSPPSAAFFEQKFEVQKLSEKSVAERRTPCSLELITEALDLDVRRRDVPATGPLRE